MAAARHNLTRRALLGAAVGAALAAGDSCRPLSLSSRAPVPTFSRWNRALAGFRRAEARLAAFRRYEATLPAEARAFPAWPFALAFVAAMLLLWWRERR